MARANLKISKDGADQESPQTPTEVVTSTSDEWITPEPTPLRKVQRLDVDAVLARSVPKTIGDTAPETKALKN